MKNFKFIYLLFVAVVALAFTACDKHEWTPGEPDATQGVFFPSTVATTYTVEKTATSVTIPVMRTNVEVASEVSVRSDDPSELFTIPSKVAFAANSENAELVISFDGAALTAGTFYSIALQIASDSASMYGYTELTIKIGVPEPWVDLGQGIYLDDFLRVLLEDVPAGLGAYVPMQQHADDANRIRVVNPFSMDVVGYMWGGVPGFFVWEEGVDTYFEFDVTDPANVKLPSNPAPLGLSANFGADGVLPLYLYVMDNEDGSYVAPITFENGVISFPKDALILAYPWQGSLSGWYANTEGMTMYLMPGVELVDYTLVPEYAGMYVTADNSTAAAILNFTVGADVDSFEFVVLPGAADEEAVAATIVDGTAENVVKGDAENATFEVALTTGSYTIVAVAYAGEEAVATSSLFFYFPGVGAGEAPEADVDFVLGSVAELTEKADYEAQFPAEYRLGILLDIANPAEVSGLKFYSGYVAEVEAAVASGSETYESIVDAYGQDVYAWVEAINEGNIRIISVQPGTNLCCIFAVETIYGTTQYYHYDYQMPAYTGGFTVCDYTITDGEFSNTFSVTPGTNADTLFVEFADLEDYQFYAVWSKEDNTLTIDGTVYGLEQYNSLFNAGLVENEDGSLQVLTSASDAEFKTPSPIVFTVANNAVAALQTYIKKFRAVDEKYHSDYYNFTPASVIAPAAAKASVVVKNVELKSMNVSSESINVEMASKAITIEKFNGTFERQFTMTSKSAVFFN